MASVSRLCSKGLWDLSRNIAVPLAFITAPHVATFNFIDGFRWSFWPLKNAFFQSLKKLTNYRRRTLQGTNVPCGIMGISPS